jgi:hypothetical protein
VIWKVLLCGLLADFWPNPAAVWCVVMCQVQSYGLFLLHSGDDYLEI